MANNVLALQLHHTVVDILEMDGSQPIKTNQQISIEAMVDIAHTYIQQHAIFIDPVPIYIYIYILYIYHSSQFEILRRSLRIISCSIFLNVLFGD